MTSPLVSLTIHNGIAHVQLNRPDKHNALSLDMFEAIDSAIKTLRRTKGLRAVVVSGNGESFCSGLDVKSVMSKASRALRLLWKWLPGNANLAQRVSVGWRRLHVPVIMALHGKCWGGGMQIALGGDYRIASPDCSMSVMEARWGLIPDMGGTPGLLACVSGDHGMKLAMTAEQLSSEQALSIGLITQVSATPVDTAVALAEELADRSPDTNRVIKQMYQGIWSGNERRILAKETLNQIRILAGKNQRIAVKRSMGNTDIAFKV